MAKRTILDQLYTQYWGLMYKVSFSILQDHGLAEDATHEAFLKLAKNNFKINEISCKKTRSFMVIISRSVSINMYHRVNKNQHTFLDNDIMEPIDSAPTPLELIINTESRNEIRKALQAMNPIYADVIRLKYFHDCSGKTIADILSVSEDAVNTRLHRARKILFSKISREV